MLPRIDDHARERHGDGFPELGPSQQDELMEDLEAGSVDLGLAQGRFGFGSGQFFAVFLQNVREGLLRDGVVVDHDRDPDALRGRVAASLRPEDALVPIGHPPAGYRVSA